MATYTAQQVTTAGVTPSVRNASATGDKVSPGTKLRISNGGASPITMSMTPQVTFDGDLTVSSRVNTIANGANRYVNVTADFASSVDNLVTLTWSDHTSVTFEVIR